MKKIFLLFLLASLIAGCSSNSSYENVSTEKAEELWETKKVNVIDVRSEEEYDEGHIPGAKLIPLPELADRLGELDKEQHYLIVCRSGNRSAKASQILIENGFKHVSSMEKGMNEWKYDVE